MLLHGGGGGGWKLMPVKEESNCLNNFSESGYPVFKPVFPLSWLLQDEIIAPNIIIKQKLKQEKTSFPQLLTKKIFLLSAAIYFRVFFPANLWYLFF